MATKTRKANGQGSTYKIKGTNSYRTVYRSQGRVVTATAKDRQTSRALAKAKLNQLPMLLNNNLVRSTTLTLGDFLDRWLNIEHKQTIAHTTWRRYESLARMWSIRSAHICASVVGAKRIDQDAARTHTGFVSQVAYFLLRARKERRISRRCLRLALRLCEDDIQIRIGINSSMAKKPPKP